MKRSALILFFTCLSTLANQPETIKPVTDTATLLSAKIVLKDSSSLNGFVENQNLKVLSPVGSHEIPLSQIDKIKTFSEPDSSKVFFQNGDCLSVKFATEALRVNTILGKTEISFSKISSIAFEKMSIPGNTSNGLIYWCTFDSAESIESPKVGPRGVLFDGSFVEGKYGKALSTMGRPDVMSVAIPENQLKDVGCIEFWAKLSPLTETFGGGSNPRFFSLRTLYGENGTDMNLSISANNGFGNSGLCCNVATHQFGGATEDEQKNTYEKIYGPNSRGWHHYALVWNKNGIRQLGSANHTVFAALFLDGTLLGSSDAVSEVYSMSKLQNQKAVLTIASQVFASFRPVPFFIDELKLWNIDKTDFQGVRTPENQEK